MIRLVSTREKAFVRHDETVIAEFRAPVGKRFRIYCEDVENDQLADVYKWGWLFFLEELVTD